MASTHTLTGNIYDLAGATLGASGLRVVVVTNLPAKDAVIDKTTNGIHLGGKVANLNTSTGEFTVDLIDTSATDLNVAANTLQYEVRAEYVNGGTRGRDSWSSGWFSLTADANLADLATDANPLAVASASGYALEAKGYRDEAEAISGLTGEDAAIASRINTPGSQTDVALVGSYAKKSTTNTFTSRQTVQSLRVSTQTNALAVVDTAGTNGRRLSIQPADNPLTSTASSQVEIVPGSAVSPTEVTSQILLYHKPGADYERFVISCFNNEYQFHASRLGAGVARPTFFYVDNVPITGWMTDASFRVYNRIDFYDQASGTVWGSLRQYAAGTLGTTQNFRIAEGTSNQVRIGNVAALNRPTISFGTDGTVNINRNGTIMEIVGAGLKVAGAFGVNGATAVGKQSLNAAATDAATTQTLVNQIRSALITFGLAQ